VSKAKTEFFDGEWREPTDTSDPLCVVSPTPKGAWVWWALGEIGYAPTYSEACAAAVSELQRRMDNRMAVL
jgi:hypothetical protein